MIRKPSRATRDAHGHHRKGGRRKTKKEGLKGARGENQVMDTDAMQGLANILMPMMREAMGGTGSAV